MPVRASRTSHATAETPVPRASDVALARQAQRRRYESNATGAEAIARAPRVTPGDMITRVAAALRRWRPMHQPHSFMAIAMALVLVAGVVGVAPLSAQDEANATDVRLLIHPQDLSLTVGDVQVLTAWTCDATADPPAGADEEPGTPDDSCSPVKATWSVEQPAAASLTPSEGKKVRLSADAPSAGTVVIAQLEELTSEVEVRIAAAAAAELKVNKAPAAKPLSLIHI